ncbi:hypothetical protein [Paraburkholderia sp. HP33-1]|uniref:hypothetical protein n=1 Tax=Paraburkholderia sp. HP33-1 TaxID=2883243 RepID=UPI001F3C4316|nr:hypothetical protein [Paraburkholderia sp. HP33-1]
MEINKQATIQINANGESVSITTSLSLDDLDRNGIGWCEPIKALESQPSNLVHIGTYLNIAQICLESGRLIERLGVLRRVARQFGRQLGDVSQQIDLLAGSGLPMPDLPAGWSVEAIDRDERQFKALACIDGPVYSNFWHPGARYGGLAGTPGLESLQPPPALDNASFHVCFNGAVVATVPVVVDATHSAAWVTNHPTSGYMPIEVHFSDAKANRSDVYKVVVAYLKHVTKAFGASQFAIMEPPSDHFALYKQILKKARWYSAQIWDRPYVDLTLSDSELISGIRKSYRSHINWCARNLVVEYWSGDQITSEKTREIYSVIQEVKSEMLAKYADGMTLELFMHPILMCRVGKGEVAIARTTDGVPYGVTVTTYDNGVAYYAIGGSKVLDGKNVGHFILYDAIKRAKAKGLRRYLMNRLFPSSVSTDKTNIKLTVERNINITFFKRGYSDDCEFVNVYNVLG